MDIDDIYTELRNKRMKMLHRHLTAKEEVLEDLHLLAEHMYTDGDCRGKEWLEIVSDVIDYIEIEIPDNEGV